MIYALPNDVEDYILNFAINGYTIENIAKVSKNWKNIVEKSYYKKEEKKLYNRTRILMEDKENILEKDYLDLAKKWEKFHSYRWEKIYNDRNENPEESTNLWKIGEYVDVKDKVNAWAPAKIINIDCGTTERFFYTNPISYRRYQVRFLGWSNSFDEWVTSYNIKKLGYYTIRPDNKYNGIKKERFWALLNIENDWRMVIIRGIMPPPPPPPPPESSDEEISENNEIFNNLPEPPLPRTPLSGSDINKPEYKLVDTSEGIIRIEKDKIDEKLFCSSNIVSFLLTPYRFNPYFRDNYL